MRMQYFFYLLMIVDTIVTTDYKVCLSFEIL